MTLKKSSSRKDYLLKTRRFYQQPLVQASTYLSLTLLMISFLVFFAIKPTVITISKLNQEFREKRSASEVLDQKIMSLSQAQVIYAQLVNNLPLVDKALPQDPEFEQAAGRLNYLIVKHHLILTNVSFGGLKLSDPEAKIDLGTLESEEKTLDFQLILSGTFSNLANFLTDLENLDRVSQIDSVSFNTRTAQIQLPLQVNISGKFFYLPADFREETKL